MITQIISAIIFVIKSGGYAGVFFLTLLGSCGIPIPSEIVMPFSGFLSVLGEFNLWAAIIVGTLGNLVGSLVAYYIALKGGRPLIEKYGKFVFISGHDLDKAEGWFSKKGEIAVFIGRLLPVIRTYISFPAGAARMNVKKFSFYTLVGSFIWTSLLAYLGVKLQNNWVLIEGKLRNFDLAIAAIALAIIIFYFWKHIKNSRKSSFPS